MATRSNSFSFSHPEKNDKIDDGVYLTFLKKLFFLTNFER